MMHHAFTDRTRAENDPDTGERTSTCTRSPGRPLAPDAARVKASPAAALIAALCLSLLGACATSPSGDGGSATPHGTATGEARGASPATPPLGGALPPGHGANDTGGDDTLYAALGGAAGVEALSERFIREIATDERIRGHYRDSDIGRFHRMMQEQMCERTGGGCTYTGDDMRRTHGGMNITPTEFNAIVEALMRAMDGVELPIATQNRLLALYAPMRADIIDR